MQKDQQIRPRTRQELIDIYLRIEGAIDTARRRIADVLELGKHAEILNQTAPSFFHETMRLLVGDAILALCRITDSPRFRNSDRVTVELLHELVPGSPDLGDVRADMKPLRAIRNNWISHSDLATAMGDTSATIVLAKIETAAASLLLWLKSFGQHAGLPTDDPVDQGTWASAPSLTAALRDATAVRSAYVELLAACAETCPAAVQIDQRLTESRAEWEYQPFSELEWVLVRKTALDGGIAAVRNAIDPMSPYMMILCQAADLQRDITSNTTDRRVASRIRSEAEQLVRDLQQRSNS